MEAFAEYIEHVPTGRVGSAGRVEGWGKTSRIGAFPIGIDAEEFARAAHSAPAAETLKRMQASKDGRKLILGVDRLDYSKGLEERFLAYQRLLADNENLHEQVFMLQVATTSRDGVPAYQDIRSRLEAHSGRINGAYSTLDWVPLRYVNRGFRRDELSGLYRSAEVGLVTPLRDGMNLVAKEYVAAQDPADPGVLVLSEFAGAAEQMTEALIVNPSDCEQVAESLRQALVMPLAERKRRWDSLMHGVTTDNVSRWRDNFVVQLLMSDFANDGGENGGGRGVRRKPPAMKAGQVPGYEMASGPLPRGRSIA